MAGIARFFTGIIASLNSSPDLKNVQLSPHSSPSTNDTYTRLSPRLKKERQEHKRSPITIGSPTDFRHLVSYDQPANWKSPNTSAFSPPVSSIRTTEQIPVRGRTPPQSSSAQLHGAFDPFPEDGATLSSEGSFFAIPARDHRDHNPVSSASPYPEHPLHKPLPPVTHLHHLSQVDPLKDPRVRVRHPEDPEEASKKRSDSLKAQLEAQQRENIVILVNKNKLGTQIKSLRREWREMARLNTKLQTEKDEMRLRLLAYVQSELHKNTTEPNSAVGSDTSFRSWVFDTSPEAAAKAPTKQLSTASRTSLQSGKEPSFYDAEWEAVEPDLRMSTEDYSASHNHYIYGQALQYLGEWRKSVHGKLFDWIDSFE